MVSLINMGSKDSEQVAYRGNKDAWQVTILNKGKAIKTYVKITVSDYFYEKTSYYIDGKEMDELTPKQLKEFNRLEEKYIIKN